LIPTRASSGTTPSSFRKVSQRKYTGFDSLIYFLGGKNTRVIFDVLNDVENSLLRIFGPLERIIIRHPKEPRLWYPSLPCWNTAHDEDFPGRYIPYRVLIFLMGYMPPVAGPARKS
jgi:hypothetical protein